MNNQESEIKNTQKEVVTEQKPPVKAKQPVTPPVEPKNEAPKPGYENIMAENGVNLIPTLSKEEVVVAEKKKKLNVGSIVSLLILVVVSILIVGFNIVSRMSLNNEKEKLKTYEAKVTKMTQKMISSNEITERIQLYNRVLGENYSPKSVVDYLNAIASKSGTAVITNFALGENLIFTIEGKASDMENISKFWYLLSNDPKMETVTLQSVGHSDNKVKFVFKGKLILKDFLSSTN
jgi:hypothetical protein